MKKYELTPEHREQLKPWADKSIANAMSTKPYTEEEKERYRDAVIGLYKAADLKPPPRERIIFVPSPFVLRFAGGFAAAIWHQRKTGDRNTEAATEAATEDATRAATEAATEAATWVATRYATWAATWAATRAATWVATRDATWVATRDATEDATWDATRVATWVATRDATEDATWVATRDATWDATEAATEAATGVATMDATWDQKKWFSINLKAYIGVSVSIGLGEFGLKCAASAYKMWNGGNQWSAYPSFLSFFRHIAKLDLDYSKWQHYETLCEAGPRIMHEEFCMISERPTVLKVDDQNRPHCETGPFCQWSTGEAIYAFNGVRIPAEWIENPESLTPEIALNWQDVEQRGVACLMLGWANVLEHPSLNPKIIDEDVPEIGTLMEVDLPDAKGQRVLKYRCGTGRYFAEIINDKAYDTAVKANARGYGWTIDSDVPPEHFIPAIRT